MYSPQKHYLQSSASCLGFTLLELLISMTIVGLILVIVFGSLRIGVRAWEKGEKDVGSRQRQRIVLGLIKRQLASICVREAKDEDDGLFLVKGDNKSMEFVSCIPMAPGNQSGLVYVKYVVKADDGSEGDCLSFYEKNVALLNRNGDLDKLDEDDFFELITAARGIGFQYLKGRTEEQSAEWQQTWDPDVDEGFPRAVKVILEGNENTSPIHVIARIEPEVNPR
ncbi:MAG: hypothetical protein BA861_12190 [Desulfobacterales bacterium S3730MH5]|nr:MAG: hypothetical protein BA861_12190 [Desulfobacterales bacterium S3730MH5]